MFCFSLMKAVPSSVAISSKLYLFVAHSLWNYTNLYQKSLKNNTNRVRFPKKSLPRRQHF